MRFLILFLFFSEQEQILILQWRTDRQRCIMPLCKAMLIFVTSLCHQIVSCSWLFSSWVEGLHQNQEEYVTCRNAPSPLQCTTVQRHRFLEYQKSSWVSLFFPTRFAWFQCDHAQQRHVQVHLRFLYWTLYLLPSIWLPRHEHDQTLLQYARELLRPTLWHVRMLHHYQWVTLRRLQNLSCMPVLLEWEVNEKMLSWESKRGKERGREREFIITPYHTQRRVTFCFRSVHVAIHKQIRITKSYLEAVLSQSFYILYLVSYWDTI